MWNISLEKKRLLTKVLVSKEFFEWNIESLAKYQKVNFTGFSGDSIAKFIDCQILVNTLILKLKWNGYIIVILPRCACQFEYYPCTDKSNCHNLAIAPTLCTYLFYRHINVRKTRNLTDVNNPNDTNEST